MSLRFLDSFSHYANNDLFNVGNIASKYTSVNGTEFYVNGVGINISQGTGRFGGNSLRLASASNNSYVTKTLDAQATWIIGFAFKLSNNFTTTLNVNSSPMLCALYDTGTIQVGLYLNNDYTLSVSRAGNTNLTNSLNSTTKSNKTLSANTWNYIEFQCTISSSISSNSCRVLVNGEVWINLTAAQSTKNTANSTANQIYLGCPSGSGTGNFDYCDFYICDGQGSTNNAPLGDVRVECRLPKGTGTNTAWVANGDNALGCISEQYSDGDSNFISSATTNDISTFTLPALSTTPGTIFGIQMIHASRKTDAGTRQIADLLRSGSTNYPGTTINLSTSYILYLSIYETDPNTSATWTGTNANALEIGVKEIT